MRPIQEFMLRHTVRILGDQTAAARALEEAERRRAAGEDVAFYCDGNTIIVGPRQKQEGESNVNR